MNQMVESAKSPNKKKSKHLEAYLAGGFNPFENY